MLALKARVAVCPVAIEGSAKADAEELVEHHPRRRSRWPSASPSTSRRYGEDQREELMREVRKQIIDLHRRSAGRAATWKTPSPRAGSRESGARRPQGRPRRRLGGRVKQRLLDARAARPGGRPRRVRARRGEGPEPRRARQALPVEEPAGAGHPAARGTARQGALGPGGGPGPVRGPGEGRQGRCLHRPLERGHRRARRRHRGQPLHAGARATSPAPPTRAARRSPRSSGPSRWPRGRAELHYRLGRGAARVRAATRPRCRRSRRPGARPLAHRHRPAAGQGLLPHRRCRGRGRGAGRGGGEPSRRRGGHRARADGSDRRPLRALPKAAKPKPGAGHRVARPAGRARSRPSWPSRRSCTTTPTWRWCTRCWAWPTSGSTTRAGRWTSSSGPSSWPPRTARTTSTWASCTSGRQRAKQGEAELEAALAQNPLLDGPTPAGRPGPGARRAASAARALPGAGGPGAGRGRRPRQAGAGAAGLRRLRRRRPASFKAVMDKEPENLEFMLRLGPVARRAAKKAARAEERREAAGEAAQVAAQGARGPARERAGLPGPGGALGRAADSLPR